MSHLAGASFHFRWTKIGGVVAGSVTSQKSNDGVNWQTITTQALNDGNGHHEFEITDAFYGNLKVNITITGGQVDLECDAFAKGF
jgi:hypothetical protein